MASFDYRTVPIESSAGQIRLLKILPRSYSSPKDESTSRRTSRSTDDEPCESPVSCTLQAASLKDHPKYVALSYTWGDQTKMKTVLVHGSSFQITASLEGDIRNLQGEEESITLWADAICINQLDDTEKSEQVEKMKDIYESASHVVVWLGPASHEGDIGMDTLVQHGKEAADMDVHQISTVDVNNWSESNATAHAKHIGKFIHDMVLRNGLELPAVGLQGIFCRSWFQRVWVLQEVSVARDVVFVCGKKRISMSHFTAAIFFLNIYTMELLKPLQGGMILGPVERSAFQTFVAKIDTAASSIALGARRKYQGELGGPESLFQLLYRTSVVSSSLERSQATDPKDRVYALLGISKDVLELGIRPNYSKTCERVYIDTAAALLERGHLDVLA